VYARSTTIQAQPARIDEGIRYVTEEVMPAITAMDGCIGLSLLVDRDSGRCIATSAWRDSDSMAASDAALRQLRARGGEILGGSPEVQEWEIAMLHRDHRTADGACVRCTWLKADPARLDEAIEFFRDQVLPVAETMDGFCSASLMVDRRSGRAVSSTSWDSRAAMEASRPMATQLRERAAQKAAARIVEVAEFELALAHLRVPETV